MMPNLLAATLIGRTVDFLLDVVAAQ